MPRLFTDRSHDSCEIGEYGCSRFLRFELSQHGTRDIQLHSGSPEHPSTPNNLASFDTNDSCFLDDPEQFVAIDNWVGGQVSDGLFFGVVDAWVTQRNVCVSSSLMSLVMSGLSMDEVVTSTQFNSTTFNVQGQGIASTGIEIYSLDGHLLHDQNALGSALTWNWNLDNGAPIANGTYLYLITAQDQHGAQIKSGVKKLSIIR